MARREDPPVISAVSCLTIIIFGVMIFVGLFFFFVIRLMDRQAVPPEPAEKALMTVIPAPTLTPTVYATKEPQTLDIHYVSEDGFRSEHWSRSTIPAAPGSASALSREPAGI